MLLKPVGAAPSSDDRRNVIGVLRSLGLVTAILLGLPADLLWSQSTIGVPADFPTIQEAIDAASDGDTVLVAPGAYEENIDFLGKAIAVVSSGGADVTTIDGSACTTGIDTCSVVTFENGEGSDSVLDGFTVTGGEGTLDADPFKDGGGIRCSGSSPTIANCAITGNSVTSLGGGMYTELDSAPSVIDCVISDNFAGAGGGVHNFASAPTLTNCIVSGNVGDAYGGGLCNVIASPILVGCTIADNISYEHGGGICLLSSGAAVLVNCTIRNNLAYLIGGGLANLASTATLSNCVIVDNAAYSSGGGVKDAGGTTTLIHCTLASNGSVGGGGVSSNSSSTTLTNCILWGNAAGQIAPADSPVSVSFCNVQGGWPGVGNIDVDPLFVAPLSDFRLQEGSPCINLGTNDPVGGLPATDADGNPRVVCDVADMGAYEAPEPVAGCDPLFVRGDANADGAVDVSDALFLVNWLFSTGPPGQCNRAGDVDANGAVQGLVDTLYLLGFLFNGGAPPPVPYPGCGSSTPFTGLGCSTNTCP